MIEIFCDMCGRKANTYETIQMNLKRAGRAKTDAVIDIEHDFCLVCAKKLLIKIERECIGEIYRDDQEAMERKQRVND